MVGGLAMGKYLVWGGPFTGVHTPAQVKEIASTLKYPQPGRQRLPLTPGFPSVRYPIPQQTFKYVATVQSVTDETCQELPFAGLRANRWRRLPLSRSM